MHTGTLSNRWHLVTDFPCWQLRIWSNHKAKKYLLHKNLPTMCFRLWVHTATLHWIFYAAGAFVAYSSASTLSPGCTRHTFVQQISTHVSKATDTSDSNGKLVLLYLLVLVLCCLWLITGHLIAQFKASALCPGFSWGFNRSASDLARILPSLWCAAASGTSSSTHTWEYCTGPSAGKKSRDIAGRFVWLVNAGDRSFSPQ